MDKKRIYLDHAGATLASPGQLEAVAANLARDVSTLGNPHSKHQSGVASASAIRRIRERTLALFGVAADEYAVVFTKNTTDSVRLAVESLNAMYAAGDRTRKLVLFKDSHTSLHGIRERLDNFDFHVAGGLEDIPTDTDVFLMTAMSNFCGKKYPESLVKQVRAKNGSIAVILDVAALCGTSPVDLHTFDLPEFVAFSFYKIFGFPTGVGCLLIRKARLFEQALRPRGFAGGSVAQYNVYSGSFVPKDGLEDRFEAGTPDFHGIALLKYGFDDVEDNFGGMSAIQNHTFSLARAAYEFLATTRHSNGEPVARIYGWESGDPRRQGPVVNFNLMRRDGQMVGYSEVEKMCELFDIELRTGCFCNKGACDTYLGLGQAFEGPNNKVAELESKKCGDEFDLLDGKPLGSCRISFGRTSTHNDVTVFSHMVQTCFISTDSVLDRVKLDKKNVKINNFGRLTNLFVYPVKSCGPATPKKWRLTSSGLWLDRQWMVVSENGVVMTQKRLPMLCSILPEITENNTLLLSSKLDAQQLEIPLETSKLGSKLEAATVCINNFVAVDCGKACSTWLANLHSTVPEDVKLIRQLDMSCNKNQSTTFNNVADYLLITWASVKKISDLVNLPVNTVMSRFRANFVIDTGDDAHPFDEDNFKRVYIGGIGFEVTSKCTRCQMIAIDQDTGEKDPNVLLALRDLRCGDKITFGVYLQRTTDNPVDISVGNTVKIER